MSTLADKPMRLFVCKECAGERCVMKWWDREDPTRCSYNQNRMCNWQETESMSDSEKLRSTVDDLQEANNEIARLRIMLEAGYRDYAHIRKTNVEMSNELHEAKDRIANLRMMIERFTIDPSRKITSIDTDEAFWRREIEECKAREKIWEDKFNEMYDELKKVRERKMKWIRRFDEKCSEYKREVNSLKKELAEQKDINERLAKHEAVDAMSRFGDINTGEPKEIKLIRLFWNGLGMAQKNVPSGGFYDADLVDLIIEYKNDEIKRLRESRVCEVSATDDGWHQFKDKMPENGRSIKIRDVVEHTLPFDGSQMAFVYRSEWKYIDWSADAEL